jgi:hydrophobe/amphiphile efflux-1 (HAE1) family protein
MNVSAWAINKPIPALLLFIVLTLAGWMSFRALPVQNIPDFDLPTVTVSASLPGSTAATMETEVTRKIEDSLASLERIEHITSTVTEGSSVTTVQFVLEKNTQEAVDDVRDAVSRVRSQLPGDVQEPVITKVTMSGQAILSYAVEAPGKSAADLSWFIDNDVSKELLAASGVSKITRVGGVDREVHIELDPTRMNSMGVTAADVSRLLRTATQDGSGGRTEFSGTEQAVRALGTVKSVEEIAKLPLALSNGQRIVLGDVARVTDTSAEQRQLALLDGKPVVSFQVFRSTGTSEVDVAKAVRAKVAKLQAANPQMKVVEIGNSVSRVQSQYDASMKALYEGAFLAVVVVWLFLRDSRATFVSAVALPLSVLPTFFAMHLFDFSLNTITLLALTLVVGILVDDAIVEVENIVRHLGMGKTPRQAAIDAAAEIGLAVIATSMTLVAVFLPTAFMAGIPGKFFKQFGWTAALAVLASLLVARLLTPMMAASMMKPSKHEEIEGKWTHRYLGMLEHCLKNPWKTSAAAVAFFVASIALMTQLPSGFIPASDNGKLMVAVELAPGSTLSDTTKVVEAVRHSARAIPEVVRVYANAGGSDVRNASVTIDLDDKKTRSQTAVESDLRERLSHIPGARFSFGMGGSGEKLTLVLSGDNAQSLNQAAAAIERDLRTLPGLGNVSSSASLLRPELTIRPDLARAADLGVTASAVGQALRVATTGDFDTSLAKLNLEERQLPIRVTIPKEQRQDPEVIGQLRVQGKAGLVPLENFSTIALDSGPAQIARFDRRRNVVLSVELAGKPLGEVMKDVNKLPSLQNLPTGVSRQASGDLERMQELFSSFGLAMALGVLSVYFVLVLLFHDFVQPATILAALPLSVGGAVIALMIGGYSLSMPVLIGLLMLMGIVTKNSILLVEYAARIQRERAISAVEAMREACAKRVRPILMTTVAMAAGMAPIAFATAGDSSFRAPMAVAVIGGLLTSTVLSLFVVPAVYRLVDTLKLRVARRFKK